MQSRNKLENDYKRITLNLYKERDFQINEEWRKLMKFMKMTLMNKTTLKIDDPHLKRLKVYKSDNENNYV